MTPKNNFTEITKSKIFSHTDKLLYFFPIAFSFLFFFKIGDASYWFDELVTINTINPDTTKDFFKNYFRNELHPPLYFVVLKIFSKLITLLTESAKLLWLTVYNFSYSSLALSFVSQDIANIYNHYFAFYFPHKINNLSEASVRLISALSMVAVNVIVFNFFKKHSLILVGLLSCLLIGLNHKMINFAQDARPYALFTLMFVVVAAEFFRVYKNTPSTENYKKLLILNSLMLLTHFYGVFVVLAQILILSSLNFRNKKIVFSTLGLFVFYFIGVKFLDRIVNLDALTFLQNSNGKVFLTIYNAVCGFFFFNVLFVCLALVTLKFLLRKTNKVDEILIKAIIFFASIIIVIEATNLVRVIFYERYVNFLIPLFILIFALIIYSASEFLSFWIKNKLLKQITFLSPFCLAGFRMVQLAYAITFYYADYFENAKYYPIKSAYQKISQDIDFKIEAPYVLEEFLPEYFHYYEKLFKVKPVLNLNPKLMPQEKNDQLRAMAATLNQKVIYYIKVKKPYLAEARSEPIVIPGYSKQILFNQNAIILFKFQKEN